jgi:hypothetical protein
MQLQLNMKIKFLFLISLFLFSNPAFCQEYNCLLTGNLKHSDELTSIYLIDDDKGIIIDSSEVISGNFSFQITIPHPKQFILHNFRNQYEIRDRKTIWLEPGEMILEGDFNYIGNSTLKGSKSNDEYTEYKELLKSQENIRNEIAYLARYKWTKGV